MKNTQNLITGAEICEILAHEKQGKNMIAEYNGKTYKCSFYKGKIILISENCEDGFSEDFDGGYIKTVDRSECDRVYKSTPMVRYEGKEYLYYEETDDKIQLYDDPSVINIQKNG